MTNFKYALYREYSLYIIYVSSIVNQRVKVGVESTVKSPIISLLMKRAFQCFCTNDFNHISMFHFFLFEIIALQKRLVFKGLSERINIVYRLIGDVNLNSSYRALLTMYVYNKNS